MIMDTIYNSYTIPGLPGYMYENIRKEERWEKEIITLDVRFKGEKEALGDIRFMVHPSEYKQILQLKGEHRGFSYEENSDIVISLFPSDIFIVCDDDYKEVKTIFEEKEREREVLRKQKQQEEKAKQFTKEVEDREKRIKNQQEYIDKQFIELEKQRKELEIEKAQKKRERKPWYRRIFG